MVIITGATGGIGAALTRKVLLSGKPCFAVVRNANKLGNALSGLDRSKLFVVDYQLNSFAEALSGATPPQISQIALVLSAFDISPIKRAAELTKEEIRKNIEFNIAEQIEITIKALEFSISVDCPLRIINLDSGAAYRPISGWSMYCAGKAYMNMFLKVFSQENGISLALYDPGVVDTKMQETIRAADQRHFPSVEKFIDLHLSNRLHSPDEVAEDILKRYLLNQNAIEVQGRFADKR